MPAGFREPVHSAVPTLLMSGRRDPVSPPRGAATPRARCRCRGSWSGRTADMRPTASADPACRTTIQREFVRTADPVRLPRRLHDAGARPAVPPPGPLAWHGLANLPRSFGSMLQFMRTRTVACAADGPQSVDSLRTQPYCPPDSSPHKDRQRTGPSGAARLATSCRRPPASRTPGPRPDRGSSGSAPSAKGTRPSPSKAAGSTHVPSARHAGDGAPQPGRSRRRARRGDRQDDLGAQVPLADRRRRTSRKAPDRIRRRSSPRTASSPSAAARSCSRSTRRTARSCGRTT